MVCSTRTLLRSALVLVVGAAGAGCASIGLSLARRAARGPATRQDVTTVGPSYRRRAAQVLVRRVSRPSRASLDYAAYHANFMNADPAPEGEPAAEKGKRPNVANPFGGALVACSLTGSVARTALSPEERTHPLALPPLVELLVSKKIAGADRLEDVVASVRSENWGLAGGPQFVRQTATEAFLHDPGQGRPVEIWLKIEFAPWFTGFLLAARRGRRRLPRDLWPRCRRCHRPDPGHRPIHPRRIRGPRLTPAEVKAWAHQLASYWYPSYNTDLVTAPAAWPAADTEAAVRGELGNLSFAAPTVVMRGKPQGKPVYNVFLVDGAASDR